MDAEQQIRLNFLDEAEEYFDSMESGLLGLASTSIDPQQVDVVLRSAHSLKGGAAMMGLETFSRTAHRLEDFLKIIRVRYRASQVSTEVETLLLQGVDCLRHIGNLDRQGLAVREDEVCDRTQSIFDQLQQHLGDLEDADEDALMKEAEDVDPALLIFEEGVDAVLDRFEVRLTELEGPDLLQELTSTNQELTAFGHMASLESFTQLCASIGQQIAALSPQEIAPLADQALKTWRHSHALVVRGRIEKLPSALSGYAAAAPEAGAAIGSPDHAFENNTFEEDAFGLNLDPLEFEMAGLEELQSAFEQTESVPQLEVDFDALDQDLAAFSDLQAAFGQAKQEIASDFEVIAVPTADLSELQTAFSLETAVEEPAIAPIAIEKPAASAPEAPAAPIDKVEKMVRVPASQLKQFNTLFEQLILSRNSINLKLQQFQDVIRLMGQRVSQIERSNTQLTQWYDRASLEGFLTNTEQLTQNLVGSLKTERDRFDALEMDRYSDIHLICQEQIETIVQLQEVATDIELSLQEVNQSVRDLNYTTQSMQGNVTRTQMLPFAEVVKRAPRIIRDLNLQSEKHVDLEITGENTLLDRVIIEALNDPLMHLLRNAFDHGIEAPEDRIAVGKSASGTVTINASNQGTYTVIKISDDGGGISLDKIRDRVVQMGVSPTEVAQIPEAELLNFIFEPGFSTAQQVTELSGRGVGMDVIKSSLQDVRGDVQVTTEPGQGTTFTLRIPFRLSILRVAVIEQAGIIFAIPANSIREIFPFTSEQVTVSETAKTIAWEQTEAPLIEIENTLTYSRHHRTNSLTGNPAIDRTMAILVGDEKTPAALQISRFWYEQESTIRSIDSPLSLPPGVVASVVFGNGQVLPLIDPAQLAAACLEHQSTAVPVSPKRPEADPQSTVKTILIVDDSINIRRYLALTLEKAGYRVEQAKDGQDAVDKLLEGLSVQAVICDIEMPRLDGYGVLEEIKTRPEFESLPIAMLTSRSNDKHRKLAMNLGATAYFSKPYNEQELLYTLAEVTTIH